MKDSTIIINEILESVERLIKNIRTLPLRERLRNS